MKKQDACTQRTRSRLTARSIPFRRLYHRPQTPRWQGAFSDSAASPARLCQVPRARASISRWRRDERRRRASRAQMAAVSLLRAAALGLVVLASALPSARPWSKEGHVLTCQIAQVKTNRIVEAS